MESVLLCTSDGHELTADVALADGDSAGGVVVCHPHPQYGGNRLNPVVDAVFRHLPTIGFTALRFDFRSAFDGGIGERNDVIAALDALDDYGVGRLAVVGYSFGAAVALNTVDRRITAVVAIAPPLSMIDVDPPSPPVLVVCPEHDQFTAPDAARPVVARWPRAELVVVESADHFVAGQTSWIAETIGDWLLGQN